MKNTEDAIGGSLHRAGSDVRPKTRATDKSVRDAAVNVKLAQGQIIVENKINGVLFSFPAACWPDSTMSAHQRMWVDRLTPYGVELTAKRAKQRNGETSERQGNYFHDDTPSYVKAVCVPAVMLAMQIADAVLVTPGTRNMHLYPIPDDMGCFYSDAGTGMGRWGFTCMQPILYYGKDPYLERGLGGRANSCGQTYPNDANEQPHPCAKPIAWASWLVARGSLEGMTVCDPFMGSGTTAIACIRGRRKFVGIEKDPEHFENARKRIERELQQGYML